MIASLAILFAIGCKKDAPVPVEEGCYSFGVSTSPLGFQYSYPQYLYREPVFNPQNSDEIIYVREDKLNQSSTELRKRRISSGTDVPLVSDVWGIPDWHTNGWILLRRTDNQIWKIKSDGDSLTQLTFAGINIGPRWNSTGDKFVYASGNQTIVASSVGTPIDTISDFFMYYGDWSPDDTKLCSVVNTHNGEGLGSYDLTSGVTSIVATVPEGEFIGQAGWQSSQTIYWVTRKGFYKTDISTLVTIRIRPSCDSRYWWSFQFSGDGQKMIWERADSRLSGSDLNTIFQENKLFLLNVDGSGETPIDLP